MSSTATAFAPATFGPTTTAFAPTATAGSAVSAERVRPAAQIRPARVRPAGVGQVTVRLTRRGRAVVLGLVLLVGLALLLVGAASVSASTSSGGPATRGVVVQPGQTLWELAEQVAPDRDPRVVIAAITQLNDLSDSIVAPGQSLVVPAS